MVLSALLNASRRPGPAQAFVSLIGRRSVVVSFVPSA
jgi:hypothetical protein